MVLKISPQSRVMVAQRLPASLVKGLKGGDWGKHTGRNAWAACSIRATRSSSSGSRRIGLMPGGDQLLYCTKGYEGVRRGGCWSRGGRGGRVEGRLARVNPDGVPRTLIRHGVVVESGLRIASGITSRVGSGFHVNSNLACARQRTRELTACKLINYCYTSTSAQHGHRVESANQRVREQRICVP